MSAPMVPSEPVVKQTPLLYHLEGYDEFCKFMEELKPKKEDVVHVLFEGSKDPRTNKSWCTDCIKGM